MTFQHTHEWHLWDVWDGWEFYRCPCGLWGSKAWLDDVIESDENYEDVPGHPFNEPEDAHKP